MLEKLFTSKNRIKILGFLFFEKDESYIREISKILKINSSGVKKDVDNLLELNILSKRGNKIFLNKECNFVDDLKSIFIKTDYVVYPIKESLNGLKADFILVFGSFARGKINNESDVDLLILSNQKAFDIYNKLKPIEKKINREINPIIWSLDDFQENKKNKLRKEIISNKYILIKGDESEFRKIIERK